jgi:hypothetical protein
MEAGKRCNSLHSISNGWYKFSFPMAIKVQN